MKYPASEAKDVARELVRALEGHCERIIVAGSLRRRKAEVSDVEVLFIGKRQLHLPPGEIFKRMCDMADVAIEELVSKGVLKARLNTAGRPAWGEKNKLAVHRATEMPVDLFKATVDNWWNYLVCRTGPADLNVKICNAAIAKGWKWNPYGSGFSRGGPLAGETEEYKVESEEAVFEFVGLPFLKPEARR